jgi:hypothetical protein
MGWERRRNGHAYYYRSVRCGTKVKKVYIGAGEKGRQAADADQVARDARRLLERLRKEQSRPVDELAAHLDEFGTLVDRLVESRLVCAGWKQHQRQWRPPGNGRSRRA